jgi:hypothetical protein
MNEKQLTAALVDPTRIPLTRGLEAAVDADDLALVQGLSWQAQPDPRNPSRFYAVATTKDRRKVYMHRVIMGADAGQLVDHADGNGLNNQRLNLRMATPSLNGANRGPNRNNTSGVKGVTWHGQCQKWMAQITVGGHRRCLGLFEDRMVAGAAYADAASRAFGPFARTE